MFKVLSCGSQLSVVMGQQQLAAKWTQLSEQVSYTRYLLQPSLPLPFP